MHRVFKLIGLGLLALAAAAGSSNALPAGWTSAAGHGIGAWTNVDTKSDAVVSAALFGLNQEFGGRIPQDAHVDVIQAQQQTIGGINYLLHVEVDMPRGGCTLFKFQVHDRFGEKTLVDAESGEC